MARSPLPDPHRDRGRGERPLLSGTARLRACAYASELSFYLISAAAATLSRRLARATFYSFLPSRSGCAPPLPPCPPRVSFARVYTHTSSLSLHLLYFAFFPALFFLCPFFLTPLSLLSPHPLYLSYFSLLPYPSFSPILSLFFLNVFPPIYRSYSRTPRLSTAYSRFPVVISTPFSRSP